MRRRTPRANVWRHAQRVLGMTFAEASAAVEGSSREDAAMRRTGVWLARPSLAGLTGWERMCGKTMRRGR